MSTLVEKRFLPLQEISIEAKKKLIARIKEYLEQKGNTVFAYAHGSFIKSEKFRDIDLAIFTDKKVNLFFESDLSAELKLITDFEVEVKAINDAPVPFKMAVLRDGLLLFSKDEKIRTDFIESSGRNYMEYSHFRNIFLGCDGVRQRQNHKR